MPHDRPRYSSFQTGCFVVAEFLLTSASRGPSAIAEPLVTIAAQYSACTNASIEIHRVTSAAHPIPAQRVCECAIKLGFKGVCVCVCTCVSFVCSCLKCWKLSR